MLIVCIKIQINRFIISTLTQQAKGDRPFITVTVTTFDFYCFTDKIQNLTIKNSKIDNNLVKTCSQFYHVCLCITLRK